MTSQRKPPLFPYRHLHCQWCGEAIEPRLKKSGEPCAVQAHWHSGCVGEYRAAQNPSLFRDDLAERDGLRCHDCGDPDMSWEPEFGTRKSPIELVDWNRDPEKVTRHIPVEYRTMLEVDHIIPLWKVAELPDQQRRWYFTLANLQLRCRDCHKKKSAREAAERAHLKRLARPKVRRGPKIPSRPFPKQQRSFADRRAKQKMKR